MLAKLRHDARRQPPFFALRRDNERMKMPTERTLGQRQCTACDGVREPYILTANSNVSLHAMAENSNQPERPRLEPEIIPPDRTRREPDWAQSAWRPYASTSGGTHRIYVAGLGPFGIALLMLIVGIVAAVILLAVVGAVLIWIPVFALLLAAGVVFRLLRR